MANTHTVFKRTFIALASILSLAALTIIPAGSAAALAGTNIEAQNAHTLKYVALGDSVAAGLGLPFAADASAEDVACGRSPQAYASTVAAGLNEKLGKFKVQVSSTNVACQGAVVNNLTQSQTRGTITIQPQLDKAFAGGAPTLLTLTVGANDVHWADFVGACFSPASCDTPANTATAQAYVTSLHNQLTATLQGIRSRSSQVIPPVTVVTGYYYPVSNQCINPNLTASEVVWLNKLTDDFNTTLKMATQDAGWFVRFAPVDFAGHDICSADPWVQRPGVPGEPAAFHPNVRGQQEIGKDVLRAIGL